MTTTDTSAEAVERLAAWHERDAQRFAPSMPGREFRRETAATLRALLAERDAERVAREQWQSQVQSTVQSLLKAEAERDRLREERDAARAYAAAEKQRGDHHLAAWARGARSTQGGGT
jgi:hypothetical protein